LLVDSDAVTADMLVAGDAAAGSSQSRADGRTDVADDDDNEDSFEQLFEQLRVMKGCCLLLLLVLQGLVSAGWIYLPVVINPQKCTIFAVLKI